MPEARPLDFNLHKVRPSMAVHACKAETRKSNLSSEYKVVPTAAQNIFDGQDSSKKWKMVVLQLLQLLLLQLLLLLLLRS